MKRQECGDNFIMTSAIICTLHQILLGLSKKEGEMGWACGTHEGD
jgi:hypothetical protein